MYMYDNGTWSDCMDITCIFSAPMSRMLLIKSKIIESQLTCRSMYRVDNIEYVIKNNFIH